MFPVTSALLGGDLGVSTCSCASRLLSCPSVVCLAEVGSEHPSSPCTTAPGVCATSCQPCSCLLAPLGGPVLVGLGKIKSDVGPPMPIFGFSAFFLFLWYQWFYPSFTSKGKCCECLLGASSPDIPQLQKAFPKLVSRAFAPQSEVPKGAAKLRTWVGASSSSFQRSPESHWSASLCREPQQVSGCPGWGILEAPI